MHNNLSGPRKVVYYREVLLLGEFVIRSSTVCSCLSFVAHIIVYN